MKKGQFAHRSPDYHFTRKKLQDAEKSAEWRAHVATQKPETQRTCPVEAKHDGNCLPSRIVSEREDDQSPRMISMYQSSGPIQTNQMQIGRRHSTYRVVPFTSFSF